MGWSGEVQYGLKIKHVLLSSQHLWVTDMHMNIWTSCGSWITCWSPGQIYAFEQVFLIKNQYVIICRSSSYVLGTVTFFHHIPRQCLRWSPKHQQYTIPSSTPSYAPNTGLLMLETFSTLWKQIFIETEIFLQLEGQKYL